MVFGMCFTRFMLMPRAAYSAGGSQQISRWHTVSFVRLTTGAWRLISTHAGVNGALLGLGIRPFHSVLAPTATLQQMQRSFDPAVLEMMYRPQPDSRELELDEERIQQLNRWFGSYRLVMSFMLLWIT